jgi:hypothetical protein
MNRRLAASEFLERPWRIHEFLDDFEVEDVWMVEATGAREDFPRVVELIASMDTAESSSAIVRFLFAARWKIGGWLGWDDEDDGLGRRVPSLRARLPEDLAATTDPDRFRALPFTPLYEFPDEFAAEIANKTMHGVMHLGAVPAGDGRFSVQMTVLVKTNGLFGRAYMAFIKPFRYVLVYPPMIQEMERRWHEMRPRPTERLP